MLSFGKFYTLEIQMSKDKKPFFFKNFQNTPEHFQYAQELFQYTKHLKPIMKRSKYLLAGLALKQNEPTIALNLVHENKVYVSIRFIRFLAFTQSGRFDDACAILRQTIDYYKARKNSVKTYFGIQMVCYSNRKRNYHG